MMSARTEAAVASVGGLCVVACTSIPNVCYAVYMLMVANSVEQSSTCLAPYQMEYSFNGTVPAGDRNPSSGGPTYESIGAVAVIDHDWMQLVHHLKLYAKFQLILAGSIMTVFIGGVGMLACEIEACLGLTMLGLLGWCCMGFPSLVVMVSVPCSTTQFATLSVLQMVNARVA
jgi:hypothetical protein